VILATWNDLNCLQVCLMNFKYFAAPFFANFSNNTTQPITKNIDFLKLLTSYLKENSKETSLYTNSNQYFASELCNIIEKQFCSTWEIYKNIISIFLPTVFWSRIYKLKFGISISKVVRHSSPKFISLLQFSWPPTKTKCFAL